MAEDSCELCPERIKPGDPKELVYFMGGYVYVHKRCYEEQLKAPSFKKEETKND
jgi:hypothetical protein